MAMTKLWHIKGRLKDLLAYVENPEKTIAETPDLQPLWNVLSYVQRPAATEKGEYVTAVNCLKEIALQQMIQTKKQFGKGDQRSGPDAGSVQRVARQEYEPEGP